MGVACERYGADCHLMVLMPNYLDLLLTTPNRNVDDVMRYFLSTVTRSILGSSNRINHILGGRYRWCVLGSALAFAYTYKFICRNPIREKECLTVQGYPFITLNDCRSDLPVCEGFRSYWDFIPKVLEQRLNWLNQPAALEQEKLVKRALRRYEFKFTSDSNLQRDLRLLRNGYGVESNCI